MSVTLSKLEADILLGFLSSTYKERRKHEHVIALDKIITKLQEA